MRCTRCWDSAPQRAQRSRGWRRRSGSCLATSWTSWGEVCVHAGGPHVHARADVSGLVQNACQGHYQAPLPVCSCCVDLLVDIPCSRCSQFTTFTLPCPGLPGGRWFATILTNAAAFILNNNVIREATVLLEGPIDNFINTNQVGVVLVRAASCFIPRLGVAASWA